MDRHARTEERPLLDESKDLPLLHWPDGFNHWMPNKNFKYGMPPVKMLISFMPIVQRRSFEGQGIEVVAIRPVRVKFTFLFKYYFYYKFINFNFEIGNSDFEFENTINFLIYCVFNTEIAIAQYRNRYC